MAIVGSDTNLNAGAMRLAAEFPNLYAIVGWHPESSKDYTPAAEKLLIEQLADPKTVALGEIGLDYHWDTSHVRFNAESLSANLKSHGIYIFRYQSIRAMPLKIAMISSKLHT